MIKVLTLHGPNLNLLGTREPNKYGSTTLKEINETLEDIASQHKVNVETFQSNAEHALIDKIHQAKENHTNFIIINPAAYTHTSIALRDALLAVDIPFIEVHLSNIYAREAFRQTSYFSDIAYGTMSGFGAAGYSMALKQAIDLCHKTISE